MGLLTSTKQPLPSSSSEKSSRMQLAKTVSWPWTAPGRSGLTYPSMKAISEVLFLRARQRPGCVVS